MAPPRPGLSTERISFFTDAVFAIAMTLLVIEIPRPELGEFEPAGGVTKLRAAENLWHFLAAQAGSFYAYLLAFLILWVVWRQHHVLLDSVDRLSSAAVSWHFPLLLLVGFLPYATTVMGHLTDNPLAALLYGLTVGCLLVCRSILQHLIYRGGAVRPDVDPDRIRVDTRVSWIATGYWVLTLTLVWWTPWNEIAWFLTFAVSAAAAAVMRRRAGTGRRVLPVGGGGDTR
jgi:uncharacterized membrane protein